MKRLLISVIVLIILIGCSNSLEGYPKVESSKERETSKDDILYPEASGVKTKEDNIVLIDYSNTDHGYIMVKTKTRDHRRLKLRIGLEDDEYTYDIPRDDEYISYPLTFGDGTYHIKVYENINDSNYALNFSFDMNVTLENEYDPYLYPSIIVDYDLNTRAVDKSFEICEGVKTDIDRVFAVYKWIVKNIKYDYDKVEEVSNKYVLPILDETLELKKGICFDYAALMTCMLRVQMIPVKVVTGYVEEGYHAWVEVYIEDMGWINPDIYFDSKDYSMIDPTYDAMGGADYNGMYEDLYKY